MANVIVLFNLKADADAGAYEAWARSTDLPIVNGLDSVDRFQVLKASGLLMSDAAPPYQYIETIEINDMDVFGADISSDTIQRVAGEFQAFADNPMFILCEPL